MWGKRMLVVLALIVTVVGNALSQVDCDTGVTITESLASAKPGDTIQIAGTCLETVTITLDDLTLDGANSNAIIDGTGGERDAIRVDGARRVTIQNLVVRNSSFNGIAIRWGASVRLDHIVAEGNAESGVVVRDGASAVIANSTARNNGNDGFGVYQNATARFVGTILATQNADDGIDVQGSSSGVIVNGAVVTATSNGQSPTFGSETFEGNIVGHGISVVGTGRLLVSEGTTVTASGNAGYGLAAFALGIWSAQASTEVGMPSTVTVENNSVLREAKLGVNVSSLGFFAMSGSLLSLTVRQPDGKAFAGSPGVNCDQVSLICVESPSFMTCPCSTEAAEVSRQPVIGEELHLHGELEER